MRILADRLSSVSHIAARLAVLFTVIAVGCSPDAPEAVSPTLGDVPFAVLDLSGGSVVAEIKSAWGSSKCITAPEMKDGTQAELQSCASVPSQQFEFTAASEIRVGSNYCLDAQSNRGETCWP